MFTYKTLFRQEGFHKIKDFSPEVVYFQKHSPLESLNMSSSLGMFQIQSKKGCPCKMWQVWLVLNKHKIWLTIKIFHHQFMKVSTWQ